jgi:HD-GYP domain-containing protein (c-di-GMP phosphodiesterase class II)
MNIIFDIILQLFYWELVEKMNIKKIIKISFIIMLFVILAIGIINTIIIYQIRENNSTKELITNLVSMQEKMNELLKDTTLVNSLDELESKKADFIKYELEFEAIEKTFSLKDENDFVDFFISDIHKDSVISSKLHLLYESEKQIEEAFDTIYELEKEKINLKNQFDRDYPIENTYRKNLDLKIQELKDFELYRLFSEIKYYSKETLYQYKNQITLDKWLNKIELFKEKYNNQEIEEYQQIVTKVGNYVVSLKDIEDKENSLRSKIYNVINQNKIYSSEIEKKIVELSTNFINHTYFTILLLILVIIIFIIVLGYKVYKNVGLSVDEIETKVQEGLEEIKNLNHEIEKTQKEVVFTMGAIGESRSKETGNHVKRVAEYSKLLALYYGLNEKEAEMLKQASPMHDIGKVAIPDAVLNKPGRFDESEREIMNTHAALGYEMLKHSNRPLLKMAAVVANEHHEKWDGTGYPRGLSGENIHIYGRITALADVFDALGSHRVYKKAWDDERIFNLFKEERGKHFDPKLVDIFFEHLDEFLKIRETFKDKF